MFERFRRQEKKDFVVTGEQIWKVAGEIIGEVNNISPSVPATDIERSYQKQLFRLAGLKDNPQGKLHLDKSRVIPGGVDVVTEDGRISFSLGIGETSLIFVNKNRLEGKMINKFEPLSSISTPDFLRTVVNAFILLGPQSDEIVDMSKEAWDRKMNADKDRPMLDSHLFPSKE